MDTPPDLAPFCTRCRRHHLYELPCWAGRYCQTVRTLVLELKGDVCWLCGHPGATTADHVRPRSRGGTDALDNLRPAHRFCNTGRGAADPRTTAEDRWWLGLPVPTESTDRW